MRKSILLPLLFVALANAEYLDQVRHHQYYKDGEFERLITSLEGYQRRNRDFSRDDSLFIAKHLAVVYSANPTTREKGRYYMHRLLELNPRAKLVDMFVGDEVDKVFEKVREEFMTVHGRPPAEEPQYNLPKRPPADPEPRNEKTAEPGANPANPAGPAAPATTAYWLAGFAGIAAIAGGAAYYYLHEPGKAEDVHYPVSEK